MKSTMDNNAMKLAEAALAHGVLVDKKDKPPKKMVKSILTRRGHGGKGYIHEHNHVHPDHKMEEHVSGTESEMLAHMKQHLGDEAPTGGEEPEMATGGQQTQMPEQGM